MGSRKIGPLLSVAVGVSEPESGGAYSLSDEDEEITLEWLLWVEGPLEVDFLAIEIKNSETQGYDNEER